MGPSHRRLSAVALVVAASVTTAHAQPAEPPTDQPTEQPTGPERAPEGEPAGDPAPPAEPDSQLIPTSPEDTDLGPLLYIERIDVDGNTATQDDVIRRVLPIAPGDVLRASDKRLHSARFKVLALGFFRDVRLEIKKGSARGQVILIVNVVERGTIVLNRLWFGTNELSPYWLGADLSERNLLGLGITLGGGFIYAGNGEVAGSRPQWAGEVRVSDGSVKGTRFGANASMTVVHGSEAYRVTGTGNAEPADLRAFPYRRIGGRAGFTYDATALTRLSVSVRGEEIRADLPVAPTQQLPDGRTAAIDLHLEPGTSDVVTLGFVYDRDTRPDPILSHAGGHLAFGAELGSAFSDYQFATLFGRYEHYWPLKNGKQAIGLKLAGGVVVGDAPRFDRIHLGDVNRMLTPRAAGLVLSTASPFDLLGTRADKPSYGDLGGSATLEYAVQLFRGSGKKRVYGGDVFFGAGLWGLAESADLRARDSSLRDALPIDLYMDAGVRIDTDIGIFELTLANALGRVR
jgi:outer membrane protein assembly factor BamA